MGMKKRCFSLLISFIAIAFIWVGVLSIQTNAYGEDKKGNLSSREIAIAPKYPGMIVKQGDDITLEFYINNYGLRGELINVTVESAPKDWDITLKSYSDIVTGIHVPKDDVKTLSLSTKTGKDVDPGKYDFVVKAQTNDKKLTSTAKTTVYIKERVLGKKSKGVEIDTNFPVLEGPTGAKFEFALDVLNHLEKDTIFNFSSQGPENWEIKFKPTYEEKYISSLVMKERQTQSMAVEVIPYPFSSPGEYPIKVRVESPEVYGEVELKIILTGTYKMEVGTADGRLSLNASQGKPANISFYVKNNGSATYNMINFLSFKPENWKVEFKPESLNTLKPGDLSQVEAIITPADQALVGDYSVRLNIDGERSVEDLELRVTVRASTAWGWIGIAVIIFVIAVLVFMFIKLGRR